MEDQSETKVLATLDVFNLDPDVRFFDFLMDNMGHIVGDLKLKSNFMTIGAGVSTEKSRYKSIRAIGAYTASNDLMCDSLFTAGASTFRSLVIVDGPATINGASVFLDYSIFAGDTKIAGVSKFKNHILSSGKMMNSSRMTIEGSMFSDNQILNSGTITAQGIQTTSSLISKHILEIDGNIRVKRFLLLRGGGSVNTIQAEKISIGFKDTETYEEGITAFRGSKNILNPISLGRYIKNVVRDAVAANNLSKHIFEVKGDLIADEIFLSNCIIRGNIYAKNVIIGPNVEILGKLDVSENLEIADLKKGQTIKQKKQMLKLTYKVVDKQEYLKQNQQLPESKD